VKLKGITFATKRLADGTTATLVRVERWTELGRGTGIAGIYRLLQ